APPELRGLSVALMSKDGTAPPGLGMLGGNFGLQGGPGEGRGGGRGPGGAPNPDANAFQQEVLKESQRLRKQSAETYNQRKGEEGARLVNDAAALEQANEILLLEKDEIRNRRNKPGSVREGQSVTYH